MPITDDDRWAALTDDQKAAAIAAALNPDVAAAPVPAPEVTVNLGEYAQLNDFLDDTLQLAYQDSRYDVLAPDIDTGLECQKLLGIGVRIGAGADPTEAEREALSDTDEMAVFVRVLGGDPDHPRYDPAHDVWAQLKREGRSWPFVQHVARTVIYWVGLDDREFALRFWLAGARPKAPEPVAKAPQDRKPKGGGSTTKRRASGSSTRPKPKP